MYSAEGRVYECGLNHFTVVNRRHHYQAINSVGSRTHHVHATLCTNTGQNDENDDDVTTTRVSITHHQAPRGRVTSAQPALTKPTSPPFADATDTDDNSDEYDTKKNERVPVICRTRSHPNQLQPRYCSLQCYKAANATSDGYNISKRHT